MNTVTITSKCDISLSDVEQRLRDRVTLLKGALDRIVIQESNSRVYIYHPELDSDDMRKNQLYLDYSSEDLVKKAVEIIADDPELTVENEFGIALPGDQFVARLKAEGGWKWSV